MHGRSGVLAADAAVMGGKPMIHLAWSRAAVAAAVILSFGAHTASAQEPPPASAWAREAAIASVDLSADGRHLVAVTSPDGARRLLTIWNADDIQAQPYVVGSDEKSEIVAVQFIKNDRLFVTTQQLVDFSLGGQSERSYRTRTQVLDLRGEPVRLSLRFEGLTQQQQAFVGVGQLVSDLPNDDQSILVRDPMRGDLYKLNLYTGRAQREQRGSTRFSGQQADLTGEIRAQQEFQFDNGAAYIGQWIKDPATGEWSEHFRSYARDRRPMSIVGFSNDANIIFVRKAGEGDNEAIYEYDIAQRAFGEVAFAHPFFDAGGVIRSRAKADFGEVLGFTFQGERGRTYWTDPMLEAATDRFRQALGVVDTPVEWTEIATGERRRLVIGGGAEISISATSDDRTKFVLQKSGPGVPPEYYLVQDGRIALLGRAYPELRGAKLGTTSLIQYTARDGLVIPAFLTQPDAALYGPGPYPTLIVPHGGPWARDDLNWDPTGWTQYFAARGYAVLQPQFRGSDGWGQRLWRAGDREWGRKMQDDVDDGARHLIDQRIAASDRIAVHGYSFGGYTAMMAAVRPNGLYQCAVAGAGPATIDLFKKGTYNSRYLREFQHPTAEGEDPLRRVGEVSIPVYLYSGDRDTNVIPAESRAFAAALERAGKDVQLRILPDMEHSLSTWTPANIEAILTTVDEFLKTRCGPDGL
jgi:dienelactone hydrolase